METILYKCQCGFVCNQELSLCPDCGSAYPFHPITLFPTEEETHKFINEHQDSPMTSGIIWLSHHITKALSGEGEKV